MTSVLTVTEDVAILTSMSITALEMLISMERMIISQQSSKYLPTNIKINFLIHDFQFPESPTVKDAVNVNQEVHLCQMVARLQSHLVTSSSLPSMSTKTTMIWRWWWKPLIWLRLSVCLKTVVGKFLIRI